VLRLNYGYNGSKSPGVPMEPRIIEKPEIRLVGMSFYGDPFDTHSGWDQNNEIGRVWVRFFDYLKDKMTAIPNLVTPDALYELHIYGEEMLTIGYFEAFVGIEVENLDSVPLDLLGKLIPVSQYAVFTLEGEQIVADWHLTVDKWIADAGYQRDERFSFQYYDHRFKGLDRIDESILDVYLPIATIDQDDE
jgi:predicted transcriptional regulator YdeE